MVSAAARDKELHWFDRRSATEPIERYWADFPSESTRRRLSAERRRTVVTGEATPLYLFHPLVPASAHRRLPDAKLIVLLRDPVERAISHYWMEFNRDNETLSLEDALTAEAERTAADWEGIADGQQPGRFSRIATYAARGDYADQLERWLRFYARRQLLILTFEDLVADPEGVYRRALELLDVDSAAGPLLAFTPERVGSKQPTRPETVAWLQQRFRLANARLAELTGIDYPCGPRSGPPML